MPESVPPHTARSRQRPSVSRRGRKRRSTARSTRWRRRARRIPRLVPLQRLAGAVVFLGILTWLIAPLRSAALTAHDAVMEAAGAGRHAAAHDAIRLRYMVRYGIPFDLAAEIERAALAEGIDPELAFRLVRVESQFVERAVSPAGALGLTQLMPATADELQPGITREQIFERETNLRLGFRYLGWLLRHYGGDLEEALHAYNRGPGTVARIRAAGGDPANGYADRVLRGSRIRPRYQGNGFAPTLPPPLAEPWTVPGERRRSPISAF
jgi:soluble lytic murein transglycosylase-like protein